MDDVVLLNLINRFDNYDIVLNFVYVIINMVLIKGIFVLTKSLDTLRTNKNKYIRYHTKCFIVVRNIIILFSILNLLIMISYMILYHKLSIFTLLTQLEGM